MLKKPRSRDWYSKRIYGKQFNDISMNEAMLVNSARVTGLKSILGKQRKAYSQLHKTSIIETYGSRKKFRDSLKQRQELNRLI